MLLRNFTYYPYTHTLEMADLTDVFIYFLSISLFALMTYPSHAAKTDTVALPQWYNNEENTARTAIFMLGLFIYLFLHFGAL